MKKTKFFKSAFSALTLFTVTAALFAGHSLKRQLKPGDYIPEEHAYYGGPIDDPAGLIKAHKFVTPTDNKYNDQKTRSLGTSLIGDIESVWSTYTGKGTTIAVIDDGFDVDHPEFTRSDGTSAILSTSRYYYAVGSYSYNYQEYSEDPDCIKEDWEEGSKAGKYEWATHGTATSTTAAAPMNNGGGVGIAPEANILALKIDFSFIAIREAIRYAITQGVDVINMSLGAYAENFTDGWGDQQEGSSSTSTYLNDICQSAYNAGIIVVAAAGNESTYHKSYPACNTKVIGVGALGDWDNKGNATKLAEFTNYVSTSQTGEINVDILAPGYVYTAEQTVSSSSHTSQSSAPSTHSHTWNDTQGTSFSSPIIAGAACLWKQKYPNGTPDQFLSQLQSTADGIGTYASKMIPVSGWDDTLNDVGPSNIQNGRLNVAKLLDISEPYVSTVQSNLSISVGEKKQIDLDTYNGTITYSSSNTSVATVSNTGLVEGKGAGNATITVTATKNGHTATATVGVNVAAAVAATSLNFNPKSVTLTAGQTYNAEETITLTPSNASRIFLFESKDKSVATVDEDTGLVTAISEGQTTINVIAGYGTGDDSLTVNVEAPSAPTSWDKVTSTSDLENGDYLIVYSAGSKAFDGSLSTLDATNNNISVSISNNKITYSSATEASKFTIQSVSGGYSIQSASGYYIGRSNNSNGLDTSTSVAYVNTISISSGDATITGSGGKVLCYNTQNGQDRFRYMSSGGAIQLFKASSAGGGGTPTPTVSSVTVSPSALNLDLNGTTSGNLSATVNGTNSPAQTVNWSSSNTNVATVSSGGVVTAKAVGSAIITATSTVNSTKSGSCSVTVTDSTPVVKTLSSISISGQTTSLPIGSSFSFGGTVTAHFSDSSTDNVTSSATFDGYNMAIAGNYTVTVSYTYNGTTKTTSYSLEVYSSGGSGETTSCEYTIGWGTASGTAGTYSNFTATSGSVTDLLSFNCEKNNASSAPAYNGNSSELRLYYNSNGNGGYILITPVEGVTFTGFTMTTSTSPTVKYMVDDGGLIAVSGSNNTYSVSGISATSGLRIQNCNTTNTQLRILTITLTYEVENEDDKVIANLSASYSGANLYVGDSLDESKVTVTANYTDSSKYQSETLASTDYTLSGFTSSTPGTKQVTVTYTGSLNTLTTPLTTTFNVTVLTDTLSNVSVTNSKTYHPGESINKSDITVTLTYESGKSSTTSDFTFASDGYQFTYADAPSGGGNATKQFSINYGNQSYNFTVNVSRVSYQTPSSSTITLSSSQFENSTVSKSSGTASSTSVTIGGVGFTVTTNAYIFTQSYTSYLSFNKGAGSINNTDAFATDLTSISVTQKASARQDGVLTISKDNVTYVSYSANEIAKGGYRYFKYEYTSATSTSGAAAYSNIENITYTLSGQDNPTNVANYIMFEDTSNQCLTKLDLALDKLNTMSSSDKTTFWTSNDYVISTARERLEAWARHEGKTISLNNGIYQVNSNNLLSALFAEEYDSSVVVLIVLSIASIMSVGMLLIRKKRQQN